MPCIDRTSHHQKAEWRIVTRQSLPGTDQRDGQPAQTGALIEAKGPGFARNLKYDFLKKNYISGFVRQARAQAQAAGPRAVVWYFAEHATSNAAAEAFANEADLVNKIRVRYIEAIVK